jgi:hypothetical protein
MDKREMILGLGAIQALYPRHFEPNATMVRVWLEMCSDLNIHDFNEAVKNHARTEEWPPTVAHIRAFVFKMSQADVLTAEQAWEMVLESIRTRNFGDAFECADELAMRAAYSVGWSNIESGNSRSHVQHQFIKTYNSFLGSQQTEDRMTFNGYKRLGGGWARLEAAGGMVMRELPDGQD